MAIPKKGSRKILVEGLGYRWLIRKHQINQLDRPGERMIHVAVEPDTPNTQTLVIDTGRMHETIHMSGELVTPSDVRLWNRMALNHG